MKNCFGQSFAGYPCDDEKPGDPRVGVASFWLVPVHRCGDLAYQRSMSGPIHDRSAERVQVDAFVKISGDDGQELVFRTRDLSEHGLFLYTRVAHAYPFKVGSTLQLELYDFDRFVRCKVVVVRVVEAGSVESEQYPTGFGVRIVSVDEAVPGALRALVGRAKDGLV